MTAIPTAPGFDIGRVIQRLFGVLGRNFVTFLLLAILLVGLPTGIASLLQIIAEGPMLSNPSSPAAGQVNFAAFAFVPLVWLIAAAANAVLQGAVIHATVSDLSGSRIGFGEALGTGLRNLLPLIGVGLISAICVFFGFLVFIVPGVLLALAWSVATPALIVERTGLLGAFGRSLELTRDNRIQIFALAIIAIVIGFIVQMAATVVAGVGSLALTAAGPNPNSLVGFMGSGAIVGLISQTTTALIGAAGIASVYYELRFVKEGVGAQDLAAVFD